MSVRDEIESTVRKAGRRAVDRDEDHVLSALISAIPFGNVDHVRDGIDADDGRHVRCVLQEALAAAGTLVEPAGGTRDQTVENTFEGERAFAE